MVDEIRQQFDPEDGEHGPGGELCVTSRGWLAFTANLRAPSRGAEQGKVTALRVNSQQSRDAERETGRVAVMQPTRQGCILPKNA